MKKNGFAGDDNITLLAKGVVLTGEIRVEGTVRIDGRLDGEIQTKGKSSSVRMDWCRERLWPAP